MAVIEKTLMKSNEQIKNIAKQLASNNGKPSSDDECSSQGRGKLF
jgi:hypothetical protein